MEITSIEFTPSTAQDSGRDNNILGRASIVFDGVFLVRDLTVRRGKYGPWIAWPSRKKSRDSDEYIQIATPLVKEFFKVVKDAVVEEAGLANGQTKRGKSENYTYSQPGSSADVRRRTEEDPDEKKLW